MCIGTELDKPSKRKPEIVTLVNVQNGQQKDCKLLDELDEETPDSKLCVDLIGPYKIRSRVNKDGLLIKSVTVVDPITGWFEISQYKDKQAIIIVNLVKNT